MLRTADYIPLGNLYYFGRRVTALGFYRMFRRVVLFNHAKLAINTERAVNGVRVGLEPV